MTHMHRRVCEALVYTARGWEPVYAITEHARIPLTGNQVARPPFHPGTSKACVCVCVCDGRGGPPWALSIPF